MARTKKSITKVTNSYLQQFLNNTLNQKRNSAGFPVFQEILSSNLKVTNERLEKLSGEVSHITKILEFTQKAT